MCCLMGGGDVKMGFCSMLSAHLYHMGDEDNNDEDAYRPTFDYLQNLWANLNNPVYLIEDHAGQREEGEEILSSHLFHSHNVAEISGQCYGAG